MRRAGCDSRRAACQPLCAPTLPPWRKAGRVAVHATDVARCRPRGPRRRVPVGTAASVHHRRSRPAPRSTCRPSTTSTRTRSRWTAARVARPATRRSGAGGLSLATPEIAYAALLAGRVTPGDPACSELIVRTARPGDRLPDAAGRHAVRGRALRAGPVGGRRRAGAGPAAASAGDRDEGRARADARDRRARRLQRREVLASSSCRIRTPASTATPSTTSSGRDRCTRTRPTIRCSSR